MTRHSRLNTKSNASIGGTTRWFFLVATILCALVRKCAGQGHPFDQHKLKQKLEEQRVQMLMEGKKAYQENPRDANANFHLGWAVLASQGINEKVLELLKSSVDPDKVDNPLQTAHPLKAFLSAHLVGRYEKEEKNSREAQKYMQLAYNISKQHISASRDVGEICTHLQLATELDTYPLTNADVDESVARMEQYANKLIDLITVQQHPEAKLQEQWMGKNMPGYANDPYVHCVLTLFPLSFYYRADVAKIANLHYQLSALLFPKLLYTAQHVKDFDAEQNQKQLDEASSSELDSPLPLVQSCVNRKIKLGIISSTLNEGHSVSEDFGGVLQRLDRDIFDVSYHYVHEKSHPHEAAAFMTANPTDKLYHYAKQFDDKNDGAWIRRIGEELEPFEFDMILYLDLTMSSFARRLGMERLAPVQINTHGHPLTSGIPKHTMQHFVSWAEAELPLEESQTHYTEELQLIPKGKIHQYYTPRTETRKGGVRASRMDKLPFDHLTRSDFKELPAILRNSSPSDEDIHLYTCMQKPFKVFPEFDELLCGILKDDPLGHAILHKETQTGHTETFVQRLKAAGCDMERVHFVSPQDPHKLMALYQTSTVILDSYPAGGCTTSREALELGKAIVTWPARLLGGRWTLGLYKAIGLDEGTQSKVIADSKEEYIAKAVALGTNRKLREGVEESILEAVPNLFGREEAVEEWQKILLKVSPVKHCNDSEGVDGENNSAKDEL